MTRIATHYTPTAKILHWLVAGMVVLQFVLAQLAERAEDAGTALRQLALLANHKSVGITILAVVIVRFVWRQMNPPPPLPSTMPKWQVTASHISHWTLYGLLFAMPVTGWLMAETSNYGMSWFNRIPLPDIVAPNPELKEVFEQIHETLASVLFVVASVHILAAIKHAVFDKDDVLQRMISAVSVGVFVAIVAGGAAWLGGAGKSTSRSGAGLGALAGTAAFAATTVDAALPVWQIDYATSRIQFVGDQAGAEFEGVWQSWHAELQFAADDLSASAFDVTVDTTSGATRDDDRDTTLTDPEWFDSGNFPEAYYRARRFSQAEDGSFVADGELIIKNVASPVELKFTVESDGDKRVLTGTANLDRLALGVGTGEWEDTEWIGQFVTVNVRVEATL